MNDNSGRFERVTETSHFPHPKPIAPSLVDVEDGGPYGVGDCTIPGLNLELIERGARQMLIGLGVDITDHNFASTPARVAKVMAELFVPKETEWPVFDEDYTDMVMLRGHEFYTLCPHHMLPVKLTAWVAYMPNGKVIGASKLARMLHECNRHPMTQEKLTAAALESVDRLTSGTSTGAVVLLKGEHGCFRIRGVKSCADMVTIKSNGVYEAGSVMLQQFLTLVKL